MKNAPWMFGLMNEFYNDSLSLLSQTGINIFSIDYDKADVFKISAYIVNAAFSCELALKGILCCKGKKVTKHLLNELFDMLEEKDKNEIINRMPNYCRNNKKEEFKNALFEISNNFVDWRYFYEKNQSTNLLFLRDLSKVLVDYISENYGNIQM